MFYLFGLKNIQPKHEFLGFGCRKFWWLSSGHTSGISEVCEAMDEACCVVLTVTEAVYGDTASSAVQNCTVLLQKNGQTTGRCPQWGAAGRGWLLTVKADCAWLRNITSHSCSLEGALFINLSKPRNCLRWWCKVRILNLKMHRPKIENSSEENACFSLAWLLFCSVFYGFQIHVCKALWSSDLKHLRCTVNSYISFDPNNFFDM